MLKTRVVILEMPNCMGRWMMIALVDCNNFYASCERVFNPKLENIPVIILSNNDGCVIARSNEAKKIGIKMGEPLFKIEALCLSQHVAILSSNFALYADMSNRVMTILRDMAPRQEVYSIDECFLYLNGFSKDRIDALAIENIKKVKMWSGIPVSIGVGKSKVQAKIATDLAKTYKKRFNGYCNFYEFSEDIQNKILKEYQVGDIWGVGKRYNERLNRLSIRSAYDLKYADSIRIKREFGVIMEKIVLELNGIPCIETETLKPKQQIMVSRSFRNEIVKKDDVSKLISLFTEMAAKKLRIQKSYCSAITVFLSSNRFLDEVYSNSISVAFDRTNDTIKLVKEVMKGLECIYSNNYGYKRAGIILSGIVQSQVIQNSLFEPVDEIKLSKNRKLMQIYDCINNKFECGIGLASSSGDESEYIKRERTSPHYTTKLSDIIVVR